LRVKLIILPLNGEPPEVSVAVRSSVPAYTPIIEPTDNDVSALLALQAAIPELSNTATASNKPTIVLFTLSTFFVFEI
jgi:hypothetical protein